MTEMQMGVCREMPRYRSHKEVWALKIKSIEIKAPTISDLEELLKEGGNQDPIGAVITPLDEGYAPFEVPQSYVLKHNPKAGGYYVVYKDGYKSWSPAEAFEEGYQLIR